MLKKASVLIFWGLENARLVVIPVVSAVPVPPPPPVMLISIVLVEESYDIELPEPTKLRVVAPAPIVVPADWIPTTAPLAILDSPLLSSTTVTPPTLINAFSSFTRRILEYLLLQNFSILLIF